MAKSGEQIMQLAVIILWIECIAGIVGISVQTDEIDCKQVQCSLIGGIKCPLDSNVRIIQPLVVISQGMTLVNHRNRRDIISNATSPPLPEILSSATDTTIQLPTTLAPSAIITPSITDLAINLTERCCPRAECVCKEICNKPSCHNSSLVLIETKPRSPIPGQCCAEYECEYEPDCNRVINTNRLWLIDCQICQCLAGQKICHRSCDEIRPHPSNCLSQNLKRSFSNGESWKEDECTVCECNNGEKKCLTSFCKPLNCPNKVKLTGECCPICVEPETEPDVIVTVVTPSTAGTTKGVPTTEPIEPPPPPSVPCDQHERIVHMIHPTSEKCILYAIVAVLAVIAAIFIGLYCHARSKQRSYRPVPIFDSNFNKIKSIVTS